MVDTLTEKIVMTPKGKSANHTAIVIERKAQTDKIEGNNVHIAGGAHKGIVVNKVACKDVEDSAIPEISLQFLVFLVNGLTGLHTHESRKLLFWFKSHVPVHERPTFAQEFFKELVSPLSFPRDYVGFIKMIMKLMQTKYPTIRKIEVELRQLEQPREPPSRPSSADEGIHSKEVPLTIEIILELIEAAYPHPVTVEDLARDHGWDVELVQQLVDTLKEKGLVKPLEHNAYTRIIQHDQDIQIVKQMPAIASSKQPTIAIITGQYCEKLAVDAMLENKETFVRYTTVEDKRNSNYFTGSNQSSEDSFPTPPTTVVRRTRFGESNVYTLGNVGPHRVVCTKLPTLGYTREAVTSAGNTTTRLLGTFQMVDHVFIVGVGGGIPHYTDYYKHVRLGDVVVSASSSPQEHAYSYCERVAIEKDGTNSFECKNYNPSDAVIQNEAKKLKDEFELSGSCPWGDFITQALSSLRGQSEHDFGRPSVDTDRLYMSIGERDVIEVSHPQPQDSTDAGVRDTPRLHVGPIGSGSEVCRDSKLREEFARLKGLLAVDYESDSVVDSVVGNRTFSWAVVRGVADYRDGTRRGPWQAHASLGAASVVKALLARIPSTNQQ